MPKPAKSARHREVPKVDEETPSLFPTFRTAWETRGIFSDHFLKTRLEQVRSWPKDDSTIRPIYDELMELWLRRHVGLEKGNEETTCRVFIEPVLIKLGFCFLYKEDLPASSRRMVPDYLLFPDEETKDRVFDSAPSAKYEAATGLAEAKKVGHRLDAVSKSEHRFPHQQVRDYLSSATDRLGRPYFRWGILTNGDCWRLYCRDARPDAYFEFRLAGPKTHFCHFNEFKLFVALFSSSVFVEAGGSCLLDQIRQESLQFQAELEESIRRRVSVVVKDLANGFWSFRENNLTSQDLRGLYDACLILLYRLLFVLYAEGRGLLPVKPSGAGSNANYRERYSVSRFVIKLQSPAEFQSDDFTDLYEDVRKLFHLINGDRPSVNKACGVPLYNGGLFDRKSHSKLEEWRIGDKSLANVLRDLIFSAGPNQRARQAQFDWGTIDYADLEVRQLGDIYEGLLGGRLELSTDTTELVVMGEHATLQESGTFYTPDWVVRFLVEKTLRPLVDGIDHSANVQDARKATRKDNSFANEVLKLNVLDPAMGSGHFLVRATEWLGDEIVYHPTTRFQIENVPPGTSQEQAEISYWRRRVVEACIYGVDINPLAVELAKLSLWLTCIASEEPLNFLDHHLRPGNSLIGANISELGSLPRMRNSEEGTQSVLSLGMNFAPTVGSAIKQITAIETESSDRLEIVKNKEQRWNEQVLTKLRPFKDVADLWVGSLTGLPITQFDYCEIGRAILSESAASAKSKRELVTSIQRFEPEFSAIIRDVVPFHWELEFPDVFYDTDGSGIPNPGFDLILGNPPYISTQRSSDFNYRDSLEDRFGFADDLYVHFVDQGFKLMRGGGRFGFIISDTFFTLSTKLRLRELLQSYRLDYLVQCDPFDATVDAAMFVAQKSANERDSFPLTFIQARYASKDNTPEIVIPKLLQSAEPVVEKGTTSFQVQKTEFAVLHSRFDCLRIHRTAVEPFRRALKSSFFEPTEAVVRLYNRFNDRMKGLVTDWWNKIETSKKFASNRDEILKFHDQIKPGEPILIGLLSEGAQGMRTGNNGRFLGYLAETAQSRAVADRRRYLTRLWAQSPVVASSFSRIFGARGQDFESAVDSLRAEFNDDRKLGLTRGEIYRIVGKELVAGEEDFQRAFDFRRAELEKFWTTTGEIRHLYSQLSREFKGDFIRIFEELYTLVLKKRASPSDLGLQPGEIYTDSESAPRIAAIYNGVPGKRQWVPFRKGDPEGHRWTTNEPLFIHWSPENVKYLQTAPEARWQGHSYFLRAGVTWTLFANHVGLKARLQPPCVFDAGGSRLAPVGKLVSINQFIAILNSDLFSFIIKKFIKNTQDYEINDVRMAPIVVPTRLQSVELEDLSGWAIKAKQLSLDGADPTAQLVSFCKKLNQKQARAPSYLQPRPQMRMFQTADDCLAGIELALNWTVEQIYGVEGFGPFNEF